MMPSKAQRQCCLLAICSLLTLLSAAAQQHVYNCPYEPQPVGGCNARCQKAIGNALLQLYAGLRGNHSIPWHEETPFSLCNAHCQPIPAYCGWEGVLCCHNGNASRPGQEPDKCRNNHVDHEMCWGDASAGVVWKLDLTMQWLGGRLSQDVLDALKVLTGYGLRALDFSSNKLSGTIPAGLFELDENLTSINLNFNKLTGTLPTTVKGSNMRHLYLSFNNLSGTIEDIFCTQRLDPLEALIMRSNLFTGTVDMRECTRLMLLDLTDNQLSGSLPVGIKNSQLISLRATNNRFNGSIGDDVWKLPLLTTVDLGNNRLTGSVSEYCGTSNNLVNVYLGNNSLTGTLPGSIVGNSQLLILELQNNTSIHGTFPSSGALVGLRRLDIHNTAIKGVIPDDWGQLPYLEYVDISGTRMSCCETQDEADNRPDMLPSFLKFSRQLTQFDLNTPTEIARGVEEDEEPTESNSQPNNILCPTVVRKPQPESEWNTLKLPVSSNSITAQRWIVSPIYYWLNNCTCTKFYDKSSGRYHYTGVDSWCDADYNSQVLKNVTPGPCLDMSIFYCEPIFNKHLKPGERAAVAVAALLTFIIVIGLLAHMLLAKASKFRRFLELATIRMKGPPRSGRMSLVVTDIEGYSDIFRRAPEVMYQALVQHNSVLRAAKYHNGGFVLEQEGDSYTIAFYNPFHAIVFCLQAQQGLLGVDWPPGLEQVQDQDTLVHQDSIGGRKGSKLHMRLSPLLNFGPKMKRVNTDTSTRSMGSHMDHAPSALYSTLRSVGSAWGSKMQMAEARLFNGLRVRMGVVTGDVPSGTALKNSALFQLAKVIGDFGNGGQIILDESTFAAIKDDAQALGAVDASGINYSKLSSGRSGWANVLKLCGFARPRAPAEEVVLLDMGAFCQASGDDVHELPYTTSRTLDVKQPEPAAAAAVPFWRRLFKPCSPCCRKEDEEGLSGSEVSEGSPKGPSSSPLPPAAQLSRPYLGSRVSHGRSSSLIVERVTATASAVTFQSSRAASSKDVDSVTLERLQEGADVRPHSDTAGVARSMSLSARANKQWATLRKTFARSQQSFQAAQSTQRDWESVRLFQVLPPALAARAHAWHNQLNVKDGWICWDNIYFEAPGSTQAPLTGGRVDFGSGSSYARLPSVSNHQQHPSTPSTNTPQPMSPTALPTAVVAAGAAQPAATLSSGGGSGTLPQPLQTADSTTSSTAGNQQPVVVSNSSRMLSNPLLQPLPAVTMVFMAVEGPEQLVRRRRTFTPLVQSLLSRVVRDALRRLGGYLCRVQEGDMKFMVAFASPVTALEWCLLVQMSAMYLPWPQSSILLLSSCKEVVDHTGRMVFRGPRLKMGVCEGVPRSIIPDHEGRADYHGASINMAARFMDKGAKGGQIACTLELAQQVMAVWAAGGGSANLLQGIESLRSPLSVTDSIAEDLDEMGVTKAAAAAAAGGGAAAGSGSASTAGPAGVESSQDSTAGSRGHQSSSSSSAFQPLNIELLPEHAASAAECYAAAAVAAAAAKAGAGNSAGAAGAGSSSSSSGSSGNLPSQTKPQSQLSPLGPRSAQEGRTAAAVPAVQLPGSNSTGRVDRVKSTRKSCPGSVTVNQQGQQGQQGQVPAATPQQQQKQQGGSRLAHLWLPRSRSSHDAMIGSSSETQRSSPSRAWQGARGTHSNHTHHHQQQQQQQVSGLAVDTALAPSPVAPSPFVMRDVARVPFGVEVHRLGLFAFKGGPPQQEIVQVVPTHLLGRAAFITYDTAAPASRKGQCLKRLDGQVGDPVMVQLPVLAQDYHERLAQRMSGTTGLPHRSTSSLVVATSPRQLLLDGVYTQATAAGQRGGLEGHTEVLRSGDRGSKSMTLPVKTPLAPPCSAAAAATAAAMPPVMSAQSADLAADADAVLGNLQDEGLASTRGSRHDQQRQNQQQQQQPSRPAADLYIRHEQQHQIQQQQQQPGKQQHGSSSAAADSWLVDMPGVALRHDSFGSVGAGDGVIRSDEELGLSAAEAAAARSKAEPHFARPAMSRFGRSAGQGD